MLKSQAGDTWHIAHTFHELLWHASAFAKGKTLQAPLHCKKCMLTSETCQQAGEHALDLEIIFLREVGVSTSNITLAKGHV